MKRAVELIERLERKECREVLEIEGLMGSKDLEVVDLDKNQLKQPRLAEKFNG
jgi:hypothetical protein